VAFDSSRGERGVVVWSQGRDVLRVFRAQAWVVLQDLAFDAEWCDGRLVASSSARLVAEHLRIDPGTAAAALRTLRDRGVVELTQSSGAGGRFGLAAYTLLLPPGLEVLSPPVNERRTVRPGTDIPDTVDSVRHDPCVETAHTVTASRKATTPDAPARLRRRRPATSVERSQGVLDLGTGES
jgi:hypothetical protein